ncbi:hypothetical protein ACHAXS_014002 [Conticribra weissflogii]
MKARSQSKVGKPIRRPPTSGNSTGSSGYASDGQATSLIDRLSSPDIRINVDDESYGSTSSSDIIREKSGKNNSVTISPADRVRIAQTCFALACLWPFLFLLIPPSSSPASVTVMDTMAATDSETGGNIHGLTRRMKNAHAKIDRLRALTSSRVSRNISAKTSFLQKEMSSLLHRSDVVGYGASRPRVAVVVVVPSQPEVKGDDYDEEVVLNGALESVESLFQTTDRSRIFIVTVVMDGRGKVGTFEAKLQDIDAGRTKHRHGAMVHTHDHHHDWQMEGESKKGEQKDESHTHSEKIHTLYNEEAIGVAASRNEAVHFINVLSRKHEEAGLKTRDEDLILLFLRCDATFREADESRTWLDDVTDALILPLDDGDNAAEYSYQPANAVSFAMDYSSTDTEGNVEIHRSHVGDVLAFDDLLRPQSSTANAQQMSMSNGESYPTPIVGGGATALRLETYNALPAKDRSLWNHYSADLELSFNLWMCADGIDVLGTSLARVVVDPLILSNQEKTSLSGPTAARLVSAWMKGHGDDEYSSATLRSVADYAAADHQSKKFLEIGSNPRDHAMSEHRFLQEKARDLKNILVRIAEEAKQSPTFPSGLGKKCRPFSWYVENVHPEFKIQDVLEYGEDNDSNKLNKSNGKTLPSKPLDDHRMAIISRASPVNIAYVDASGGHTEHPHLGATDEFGNFGYVHDETALAKTPPAFVFKDDKDHTELCKKGDPNWKMLTEKVYVDLTNHEAAEKRAEHGLAKKKRAKIFCLVYTIEKFHDRVPAIRETWGKKCDGFMVASTKTDKTLGTVNIPHEGPEEYNNIWQKVRSMWSYVYDNYYEKYDFFHIGGDDLYLIVENLRLYLESEEIQLASNGGHYLPDGTEETQTPLFLGRRFAEGGDRDRMFISGGSGYTMNKAALKTLVVDGFPNCFPHLKTFSEDVMVATCFRKMDILPYDTKDDAGGERYMPFQPGHHLTYFPPKNPKDDWYSNYSVDVKWGKDHCAAKSVAFHYIKEDLMRRMHAILYHYC